PEAGGSLRSGTPGSGQGAGAAAGRAAHLGSVPPAGAGGPVRRRGGRPGPDAGGHGLRGQEQRAADAPGRNPETRGGAVTSSLGATTPWHNQRRPERACFGPGSPRAKLMILCPSDEQLTGLLADALSAADRDTLARHVEECASCQGKLARWTGTSNAEAS